MKDILLKYPTAYQKRLYRILLKRPAILLRREIPATIIWVAIGLLLGFGTFIFTEKFGLNEFDDFLAGWFSPLAFYWLIRGFYQQKRELRLSRKTYELQAIELKNLVETTRKELNISEKNHAINAHPIIEIISVKLKNSDKSIDIVIENTGKKALDFFTYVKIIDQKFQTLLRCNLGRIKIIKEEGRETIQRRIPNITPAKPLIEIELVYNDLSNEEHKQKFVCYPSQRVSKKFIHYSIHKIIEE